MSMQSEKLAADIQVLLHDAEDLIKATAADTSERAADLRRRMQQSAQAVKANLSALQSLAIEKAKPTAIAADQYVRGHPWSAVGIAALAGLVVGMLSSRR